MVECHLCHVHLQGWTTAQKAAIVIAVGISLSFCAHYPVLPPFLTPPALYLSPTVKSHPCFPDNPPSPLCALLLLSLLSPSSWVTAGLVHGFVHPDGV